VRRISSAAIVVAVMLTACEPVTIPTTTTFDVLPPPDPIESTTTVPVSTTEFVPAPQETFRGALPDGLDYQVTVTGGEGPWPIHVEGIFVVEIAGEKVPVGEVSYRQDGGLGTELNGTRLLLTAGGWTITIEFSQDVFEALGEDAQATITESIAAVPKSGFPVLLLEEPFSWDYEIVPPEVRYGSLVVRRYCSEYAVACNDIHSVQVVSADRVYPGFESLAYDGVSITSLDSRSVYDPFYLDPGPIFPRFLADVIWTGGEIIVWGGKSTIDGTGHLVDGARFDPKSNQFSDPWTLISELPVSEEGPTRAIPFGADVLVASEEGTYLLAKSNTWTHFADGITPGSMVQSQGMVFLKNETGFFALDATTGGEWAQLPEPPFHSAELEADRSLSGMVASESLLYASLRQPCQRREIAEWNGVRWRLLPDVSLGTSELADCASGNQMWATPTGLVLWDADHPTMVYSAEFNTWHDAPPIPVGGQDGPPGPVTMSDRYFMVPQDGQAAIFDTVGETWSVADLPGPGDDTSIVWTGTELLAWTGTDAWRWTPDFDLFDLFD
jgi:hypothetical protein